MHVYDTCVRKRHATATLPRYRRRPTGGITMNVVRSLSLSLLLVATAAGAAGGADQKPASDTETRIRAVLQLRFPEVKIEAVNPAPVAGLYEVLTPGEVVYVDASAEYMFTGKLLSTSTRRDLSTESWNEHNRIDFAQLPFDAAIKTVRGKGSRKLAVFTDPDCPYCRKLEKELAALDDVTIYSFLFPLESLHKGATAKARNIWCAADRAATWNGWMLEARLPPTAQCAMDPVAGNLDLGARLNVNVTPTLFFTDGNRTTGSQSAADLERMLSKSATPKAAMSR
jgi:thiol:disulfide interchange protein DsbC